MLRSRGWYGPIALILAVCAMTSANAVAASVVWSKDTELCKLSLTGPIEGGDLQRFVAASQTAYPPEDEIGESTAANTVCLDSPGGSFVEGIQLAQHFYEKGVGTIVDDGAVCASACALMFMMGRAIGPEVSFVNRKLHIRGMLGFHRPSLALGEAGEFNTNDIERSYDLAVSSVVEFIVLANKTAPWSSTPMVQSDLLERIFAARSDELFLIDTVEKAARWNIELLGVGYPDVIDEERAYYACENTLQWRIGLHEAEISYTKLELSSFSSRPYSLKVPSEEPSAALFDVQSRKTGYASAGCLLEYQSGWLKACAFDEYTGVAIGQGTCSLGETFETHTVNPLAIFRPNTKLIEINQPWQREVWPVRCNVQSASGQILDDEPCFASVAPDYGDGDDLAVIATFEWPSGSKTAIRLARGRHEINGRSAQREYIEEFEACLRNSVSQNRFCYREP